jgi:transcriptional regulator with XRE-family HTH domain
VPEKEVTHTVIDITALREAKGWSTYDLANYLGCNQSTAWRMENGGYISGPSLKLLQRLREEIEIEALKAGHLVARATRVRPRCFWRHGAHVFWPNL